MDSRALDFLLDDTTIDTLQAILPKILADNTVSQQHGSHHGRAPNIDRQPGIGEKSLRRDYLGTDHYYNDDDFRRRFRVPKAVFHRVCQDIVRTDPRLRRLKDATGKYGASTNQKVTAALRVLGYGITADAVDEYCRIAESTAMVCVKRYCKAIVETYESQYLRSPNLDEISSILLTRTLNVDFLACWDRSIVCTGFGINAHERWLANPLEKTGNLHFAGSCNDINILDRSPLLSDLYNDKPLGISHVINGTQRTTPYYLTDGIYPDWTVFVNSLSAPDTLKKKHFVRMQEACRKDVERAFGVLQGRWHILAKPCKLWLKEDMAMAIRACIIMHNMIIEHDRHHGSPPESLTQPDDCVPFVPCEFVVFQTNMAKLRDTQGHVQLRNDLVEHLWGLKGKEE
ncbi:hypothetical protein AeRB84_004144 [Aphanomyces euteiches]|nr:hypothetical protein AeRB84_004144 [Aphanomyces euteiches]